MTEKILNCTPHDITILNREDDSVVTTIPPSGIVIRLKPETRQCLPIAGVPVTYTFFNIEESNIPPTEGYVAVDNEGMPDGYVITTYYIVSQMVKNAFPEREDFLLPAEVVRNADGTVRGCYSLGR